MNKQKITYISSEAYSETMRFFAASVHRGPVCHVYTGIKKSSMRRVQRAQFALMARGQSDQDETGEKPLY